MLPILYFRPTDASIRGQRMVQVTACCLAGGRVHHPYGNENATSASEYVSLYLFPPPAAITTYCLPDLRPRKVMGVAWALAGSIVSQSSLPVSLSKARKRESLVAPMNTRPPAVTIEPPRFAVPVGGIPRFTKSSMTPRTTRQRNSPRSRSMAVRCPHGGF